MSDNPELYTTRLRTFGRRQGYKLKPRQQELVDTLLPSLRLSAPQDGHQIDPNTVFQKPVKQVWFEIGFGGGEHAAAQIANNPDVGMIACEPFMNGVASLLVHIDNQNLQERVRILDDDARSLLDSLPDSSLDRMFLLFPDPWRKKRHAKRRFMVTKIWNWLPVSSNPVANSVLPAITCPTSTGRWNICQIIMISNGSATAREIGASAPMIGPQPVMNKKR